MPTSRPVTAVRASLARPSRAAAASATHVAVTTTRVYTASDPVPRRAGMVARPGSTAATQAAAMPAPAPTRRPASRRASSARGTIGDRARHQGEHHRRGVGVADDPVDQAQDEGQQGREVQLRPPAAGEPVAVEQGHARLQVGGLVAGGGVVGQPRGQAECEADGHRAADRQPEVVGCPVGTPRPQRRAAGPAPVPDGGRAVRTGAVAVAVVAVDVTGVAPAGQRRRGGLAGCRGHGRAHGTGARHEVVAPFRLPTQP